MEWLQHLTVQGKLQSNYSLKKLNSWNIGGNADVVFWPKSRADLISFLQQLPQEVPVTWLGLGSNVLIRDGGIRGAVIITKNLLNELQLLPDQQILVGAGIPCAKISKFAIKNNLLHAEFFAGIPGTIGGALRMNAGAFGSSTWEWVKSVEVIDRRGTITIKHPHDFKVSYRSVSMQDDTWFLSATLQLAAGDATGAQQKVSELLKKRNLQQPIGTWSCGSVFKNPSNNFAARLIEEAQLKGFKIGSAQISEKHANFIINTQRATAEDVEKLIAYIQKCVQDKFGITLQPEVHILGEKL